MDVAVESATADRRHDTAGRSGRKVARVEVEDIVGVGRDEAGERDEKHDPAARGDGGIDAHLFCLLAVLIERDAPHSPRGEVFHEDVGYAVGVAVDEIGGVRIEHHGPPVR